MGAVVWSGRAVVQPHDEGSSFGADPMREQEELVTRDYASQCARWSMGEGNGGCGWGRIPQPCFEVAVPGSALVSDRRMFRVVADHGFGPAGGWSGVVWGMSRRRWVGLSGSIRNPIWWMAT